MVTADFQPFFTASVAASSALIGLLFVSVSIAPERVFGAESEAVRQAQALSSFTALANVFFISLMALIPGIQFGLVVTVVALPAVIQTLSLLLLLRHWSVAGIVRRGLFLFLASMALYAYEIWTGIQLWRSPHNIAALEILPLVLLGAYAIGLGRAWELMGAPRTGVLTYLSTRLLDLAWSRRRHKPAVPPEETPQSRG